jgi:hypothetical protein
MYEAPTIFWIAAIMLMAPHLKESEAKPIAMLCIVTGLIFWAIRP